MAKLSDFQKQTTKICILFILILILLGIIIYNTLGEKEKELERVLTCSKCGKQIEVTLPEGKLGDLVCDECKVKLGYAWKCSKCDYEFSFIPKKNPYHPRKEKEMFHNFNISQKKCPNCGSEETYPFSTYFLKKRKEKKKK